MKAVKSTDPRKPAIVAALKAKSGDGGQVAMATKKSQEKLLEDMAKEGDVEVVSYAYGRWSVLFDGNELASAKGFAAAVRAAAKAFSRGGK